MKLTVGRIIFTLIFILMFPVLLLFLSGDWFWVEGWIFSLWFTGLCFTTIIYLYRKDPSLLAERYKRPGTANHKKWDQVIVYGLQIGFVAWIVFMPLDAKRFGWTTPFSVWLKILGGIGLLLSFLLFFRSYADNTFVSPLVRIQRERKQQVVSTGVYGFGETSHVSGRDIVIHRDPPVTWFSLRNNHWRPNAISFSSEDNRRRKNVS